MSRNNYIAVFLLMVVLPAVLRADTPIFTDSKSVVAVSWSGNGTLTPVDNDRSEGTRSFGYQYNRPEHL